MDLSFSPEQEQFRAKVQKFLRENLPPGWGKARLPSRRHVDDRIHAGLAAPPVTKAAFSGWRGRRNIGGQGASQIEMAIFNEEVARVRAPGAAQRARPHDGGADHHHARHRRAEAALPAEILNCEEIWCQGFSEPNSGSDLAAARTRAELQGDEFIVNGQKVWTTLGAYRRLVHPAGRAPIPTRPSIAASATCWST